jgi:MFS family permease
MPEPERPSARRNVYTFGLTSLLNDTASEMAYWILPAFLKTIGAGALQLGVIEGIAESMTSAGKLYSGYLADRIPHRKPLVVGGYAVANAVKPLLAIVTAWWQVLLIRFADRSAKGLRHTARDVMLAESVSQNRLGSAFGLVQALDSAGAILGPLLALWIISRWNMRAVFWAAAVPGALAILVIAFFTRETKGARSRTSSSQPQPALSLRGIPRSFYFLLLAVSIFSLGASSDMFLVLRAQDVGIPATDAPLLGLAFNASYTALSWPFGRLSDHVPRNLVAAAGYFIYAAVYFLFARAPSVTVLWITMAGYGLFYALTNPVLRALVAESVPAELRGRAMGIFYFVTSIGMLFASLITGFLWKRYGGALPLYLSAALAALAGGLILLYSPDRSRSAATEISA